MGEWIVDLNSVIGGRRSATSFVFAGAEVLARSGLRDFLRLDPLRSLDPNDSLFPNL